MTKEEKKGYWCPHYVVRSVLKKPFCNKQKDMDMNKKITFLYLLEYIVRYFQPYPSLLLMHTCPYADKCPYYKEVMI